MCFTEDQANYVYTTCNKNGMIGSECVWPYLKLVMWKQENNIMYPKNPFECILVNDFEQYDVKKWIIWHG